MDSGCRLNLLTLELLEEILYNMQVFFIQNLFMLNKAALESPNSQSNGSLMRITPMAVFWHRMKIDGTLNLEENKQIGDQHKEWVFKAAAEDASFTHWNETVLLVNGIYCYMITMFINGKSPTEVFEEISETITKCKIKIFENSLPFLTLLM